MTEIRLVEDAAARSASLRLVYDPPGPELVGIAGGEGRAFRLGKALAEAGILLSADLSIWAAFEGERVVGMIAVADSRSVPATGPSIRSTLGVVLRLFPIWRLPGLAWRASRRARLNFELPGDALHVAELHVAPDRRGHGIGERLLEHADSLARASGLAKLVLSVLSNNPARRLYTRNGYVVLEERQLSGYEEMCGSPGRVLMEKRLSTPAMENA